MTFKLNVVGSHAIR